MTTSTKGLRQFLDEEQQQAWLEGGALPPDAAERPDSIEHRFKYVDRFQKLLRRPHAEEALAILKLYADTCLPIPRTTERYYWSVSCLPSTSDKPLTRVNASWMELFTLLPDACPERSRRACLERSRRACPERSRRACLERSRRGDGLRSRFILHLSDFTADGSPEPDHFDPALLEQCIERPEDISHAFWRTNGILIAKVRGAASIRSFLAHPHALRAIRNFNLTHMNRGRNAYQASHCYSVADAMLGE